jgi:hypothetical protein
MAVRMEAYFDANDLWEAVEQVYEVPTLSDNPTIAQIKNHREKKQRISKVKATLFAAVLSHVCGVAVTAHHRGKNGKWKCGCIFGKYGETRNSCLLSVKK